MTEQNGSLSVGDRQWSKITVPGSDRLDFSSGSGGYPQEEAWSRT